MGDFAEILKTTGRGQKSFADILANRKDFVEAPLEKRNLTWWEKTLDPLSYGTYASAGMISGMIAATRGENPVAAVYQAVKDRTTYADVLEDIFGKPESQWGKITQEFVGLVGDIGLDPTTYLTFGAGAVAKLKIPFTKALTVIPGAFNVAGKEIDIIKSAGIAKKWFWGTRPGELTAQAFIPDSFLKQHYPEIYQWKVISRGQAALKADDFARQSIAYKKNIREFARHESLDFEQVRTALTEAVETAPRGTQIELARGGGKQPWGVRSPKIIKGGTEIDVSKPVVLYRGFDRLQDLKSSLRRQQIYHPGHDNLYFTENYASALQYAKGKPENVAMVKITNPQTIKRLRMDAEQPADWYIPTDFKKTTIAAQIKLAQGGAAAAEIQRAGLSLNKLLGADAEHLLRQGLEIKNQYTQMLMTRGMLNEEIIQGLYQKYGVEHAQHILTRRGQWAEAIRRKLLGKSIVVPPYQKAIDEIIEEINFEKAAFLDQAAKSGKPLRGAYFKGQRPESTLPRKIAGTVSAINERAGKRMFVPEFDEILLHSGQDIARSTSAFDFLKKIADTPDYARPLLAGGKTAKGWIRIANDPYDLFKDKMIPEDLAQEIGKAARSALNQEQVSGALLTIFDMGQGWWKATSLFPRLGYHFRNVVGNGALNWQAGLRNPAWYKKAHGFAGNIQSGAGTAIEKEIQEAMIAGRLLGTGWSAEVAQVSVHGQGIFEAFRAGTWWPTTDNKLIRAGKALSRYYEDNARVAHVLWRINEGDDATKAVVSAKRYLGDWENFTDIEKGLARRLFPFYGWLKHNMTVQVRELMRRPGQYNNLRKFKDYVDEQTGNSQNDKFMANWMKSADPIHIYEDKETDQHFYFVLRSWLPQDDLLQLAEPVRSLLSQLTPASEIFEQVVNKDFYFSREIEKYPGEPSSFLGFTLRNRVIHALNNLVLLNQLDRVNPGQIFGETRPRGSEMKTLEKVSDVMLGLKRYGYSEEWGELMATRRFQKEMQELEYQISLAGSKGHTGKVNRLLKLREQRMEKGIE